MPNVFIHHSAKKIKLQKNIAEQSILNQALKNLSEMEEDYIS